MKWSPTPSTEAEEGELINWERDCILPVSSPCTTLLMSVFPPCLPLPPSRPIEPFLKCLPVPLRPRGSFLKSLSVLYQPRRLFMKRLPVQRRPRGWFLRNLAVLYSIGEPFCEPLPSLPSPSARSAVPFISPSSLARCTINLPQAVFISPSLVSRHFCSS